MIREIELKCSECQKDFIAQNRLLYKESFKEHDFAKIELICQVCFDKWQEYWQIESADFVEESGSFYVTIKLVNGKSYEKIDCTAMDDIVAIGQDIPLAAQKELYKIYSRWYDERMKDTIKLCSFNESFMRTAFTCETYGGEKYTDVAFRFTRTGSFETEKTVPDYIKPQIVTAWHRYELANIPVPKIEE